MFHSALCLQPTMPNTTTPGVVSHRELLDDAINYAQHACILDTAMATAEAKQDAKQCFQESSTRLKLLEPFLPSEYAHVAKKYV